MPGGREGTPGVSYEWTRREQEAQEDREARLDKQRLRTNRLTPGQRWVTQLVCYKGLYALMFIRMPRFQLASR